jgi:hypothetical protein
MRYSRFTLKLIVLVLVGLAFLLVLTVNRTGAADASNARLDKIPVEEVLTKHLESIGSAEDRAATKNMIGTGVVHLSLHAGGKGQAEGRALMASEGTRNLLVWEFASGEYPYEKIGFDGKSLTVKPLRPGLRSPLGQFFLSHDVLFSEGLLGGTLSNSWPLLAVADRKAKLEYSGMKKIDGRQTHELRYKPKKGSDLAIKLFFDAETFQHVRSEYERTVAARMGTAPAASVSQRETRYRVIENFSDFRKEGSITLPHSYRFELNIQSQGGNMNVIAETLLNKFSFNQTMANTDFVVDE